MSGLVFIYTTFSCFDEATTVSTELLNDRLIVCVNIFREVNSLYLWDGVIHNNCEVVAIMKGGDNQAGRIVEKIQEKHSYSQPVIAVLPVRRANKFFIDWVNSIGLI